MSRRDRGWCGRIKSSLFVAVVIVIEYVMALLVY
jgi:hypothetical protein